MIQLKNQQKKIIELMSDHGRYGKKEESEFSGSMMKLKYFLEGEVTVTPETARL